MIATGTIPAVACVRMSTDRQESSPTQQRQEIEALAEREGYRILRWYDGDLGISGDATERRMDFQRMIRDASEKRDFKVILAWDQDRFGRFNSIEAGFWIHPLVQAGVRLVTVAQGEIDWSDFAGRMLYSMQQEAKHQFLVDLSRNVLRGRLAKAKAGKWTGGRAPYGYAITPERDLVLGDPERVATVRWIFETYCDRDISLADMAHDLRQAGKPAPLRHWTVSSIQGILNRETYLGQAIQFRRQKGKYNGIRGSQIVSGAPLGVKPKEDWFTVPCPPIIDRELWDRAQAKLESRRRRTTPKPRGGRALLNGLIHCGHCGRPMVAAEIPKGKRSQKRDLIYVCATYNEMGNYGCTRNPMHESTILEYLVAKIQDDLLAPANGERFRNEVVRQAKAKRGAPPADSKRLAARLAKIDADIKAAARELKRTPDDLYDLAVADLRELRQTRDELATRMDAQEARQKAPQDDEAALVNRALAGVERLRERLQSGDKQVAREALRRICERIDLWFEQVRYPKITRSYFKKGLVRNGMKIVRKLAAFERLSMLACAMLSVLAGDGDGREKSWASCKNVSV